MFNRGSGSGDKFILTYRLNVLTNRNMISLSLYNRSVSNVMHIRVRFSHGMI